MKKKAELIEDVEKAEKLAQHWKRKADKYLDKLEGVENSFQNIRKMMPFLYWYIHTLQVELPAWYQDYTSWVCLLISFSL